MVAHLIRLFKGGGGTKHDLRMTGESIVQAGRTAHTNGLRARAYGAL